MGIIKLTSVTDIKLGKSAAKQINGEKLGSNDPWKKAFFANQKDLRDKLSDFEVGDYINVVMKQDGDYWNIVDLKEVSDDEIEKAVEGGKKFAGGRPTPTPFVKRPDGGSRGDDTNRASAIYLAKDFVLAEVNIKGSLTAEQMAAFAAKIADEIIYPFIKDGSVISSLSNEKPKRARSASANPLAPPNIEE